MTFINGDAFADTTKDEVIDHIAKRFGGLDYLIYSVAAPRRTDPRNGETYQSVIKTLGSPTTTRTLEFDADGAPVLKDVTVEPATEAETAGTVQVMGGEDWARWVTALAERGLLRDGFATVALTYIGSEPHQRDLPRRHDRCREGASGSVRPSISATSSSSVGGRALTSVNGAAVTQASTAIPGIALYVSLLRATLGDRLQSPIEQSVHLWDQLTGAAPFDLDPEGRIRLDRWELLPEVQSEVAQRWESATPETIGVGGRRGLVPGAVPSPVRLRRSRRRLRPAGRPGSALAGLERLSTVRGPSVLAARSSRL